jgi:hypothetical protein
MGEISPLKDALSALADKTALAWRAIMEWKDPVELTLVFLGTLAAIVAIYVTIRIAKRQERAQQEQSRQQQITTLCGEITQHLTEWHRALREAVNTDDPVTLQEFRVSVEVFQSRMRRVGSRLKEFMANTTYQGPLEVYLKTLRKFPECADVVKAVNEFQERAVDFKNGTISTLQEMLIGEGHWGATKISDPEAYRKRKEVHLEVIRAAYDKAITEISKITAAQAGVTKQ